MNATAEVDKIFAIHFCFLNTKPHSEYRPCLQSNFALIYTPKPLILMHFLRKITRTFKNLRESESPKGISLSQNCVIYSCVFALLSSLHMTALSLEFEW